MAKMKIKELAEELGVDSKEVIKFLNDNGFEAKSSTKGIEDEQINLVKGKFGASSKKEEKPVVPQKAEVKTEAKPQAKTEAKPAAKPESKSEKAGSEEEINYSANNHQICEVQVCVRQTCIVFTGYELASSGLVSN